MYCSSCGSAIPTGLSYCNRCGADLRKEESAIANTSAGSPDSLVWGIVAVTTVGLCAVVALMVIMKEVVHFSSGLIAGFSAATFLSFVLVDALLAYLLLRSKQPGNQGAGTAQLKESVRAELPAARTTEFAEAGSSVTDQTTRTLDSIKR
ncbi:MAG: hypothetical protein AABM67_04055 [Acidobacteriota bacterium]